MAFKNIYIYVLCLVHIDFSLYLNKKKAPYLQIKEIIKAQIFVAKSLACQNLITFTARTRSSPHRQLVTGRDA